MTGKYRPISAVANILRYQGDNRTFSEGIEDISTHTLGYSLLYDPIRELHFSVSALGFWSRLGDRLDQENRSLAGQVTGSPVPGLDCIAEGGYTRNLRYIDPGKSHTWNAGASADAELNRHVTLAISYNYRFTRDEVTGGARERDFVIASANLRLTNNLFARGRWEVLNEGAGYLTHDYSLSWSPTSRLALGAQLTAIDDASGRSTARYNASATVRMRSNANFYTRYSRNDLEETGGEDLQSIQTGLKVGF